MEDLDQLVNVFWIQSVDSVSKKSLFISITLVTVFEIYRVVCVQLTRWSFGNHEVIFVTNLFVIIKLGFSISPIG